MAGMTRNTFNGSYHVHIEDVLKNGCIFAVVYFKQQAITNVVVLKVIHGRCVLSLWSSEAWGKTVGIVYIFIDFFIPVSIIMFCYVNIIFSVSRNVDQGHANTQANIVSSASSVQANRLRVTKKNTVKNIVDCCMWVCVLLVPN